MPSSRPSSILSSRPSSILSSPKSPIDTGPQYTSIPLTTGWSFKKGDREAESESFPANDVPTEIHRDLLKNGQIVDPFLDLNELSVRWVADETWTYHTRFATPRDHGKPGVVTVLNFQGLDTFATVYLNGELLMSSSNMFLEHREIVTKTLRGGTQENDLEIVFESARKKGLELVTEHSEHQFIVHQTEVSRGPVRKAQYHWGWDWGPVLTPCGPWKPIFIETYACRVHDVWATYTLLGTTLKGKLHARYSGARNLEFELENNQTGEIMSFNTACVGSGPGISTGSVPIRIDDADLWWPRGYGLQSLYTLRVKGSRSLGSNSITHTTSKTVGFRKVELVQQPDTYGRSFYFRINNVDVFCGGSCWIPGDSFLSQMTPTRYRDWLQLAADGNQTMVRVWGGGIYESDDFYAAADELGLLVWQDFMFACANYPAYPDYLDNVRSEARQNVRRLRDHPSIVIWTGNNEDYQIVERYGLEYHSDDKDTQSWLKTNFPARYIYEHLLPKIFETEGVDVPYHPSSPFGDGESKVLQVDPTVGDVHQWNVWHGTMQPYQMLPDMAGRFVSEFGMEAYPHLSTIARAITREEDRYPGSMAMDFRNKAIGHERRLVSYVAENFRVRYDLESFAHLTQVMQADTMSWAYKSWRRQWDVMGERQCGGALVWQLNDCWPTMSWAIVDYYLVPKPAYYAIKRALEPVVVGVRRKFVNWTMRPADDLWNRVTSHVDMRSVWQDVEFDVWAASSLQETVQATLTVRFISVKTGAEVHAAIEKDVTIAVNGTTEVIQNHRVEPQPAQDEEVAFDTAKADPFVIHASLAVDGELTASDVSWPEPIKYLSFPDRGVNVACSEGKAIVTAEKPVKGFVFAEKEGVRLSDNGFDLMPQEAREVTVVGCSADELTWRYVEM